MPDKKYQLFSLMVLVNNKKNFNLAKVVQRTLHTMSIVQLHAVYLHLYLFENYEL